MGAPRSTTRDLERYAGLFAHRTQVMKSSAMRDLMAITARPEVISLAGGLPDTSTFPAEDFAALMAHVAVDASAAALQYGPTEGLDPLKECIVEVMAAEGMRVDPDDLLVTTGGQQVIDLVCKTLIDPGDVVIAEAPTYPGAVPAFCSYQADVVQIEMDDDGMRIDLMEEALDRLDAEGRAPKFIYTVPDVPEPRRRDAVAGAPAAARRGRAGAASCSCSRTTRTGCCATRATRCRRCDSLDGGEYVIYLGTFSKILSPGLRLGWAAAPRPVLEKMNLGKQRVRPLLVVVHAALRDRLLRRARLAALPRRR